MTGKIASDQEPKEDKWKKIAIHNETEIKGFFGPFRFLSNFWPAKVSLDGKEYSSVENAYQAAKYKKEFRNFFRTCSPEEAVTFANENLQDRYPDEEWKEMRLEIMRKLLIQKYDKVFNPENYKKLIETGNKYLEETNYWEDIYWGVSKNDTKEYGIGENNLGKMLMENQEHFDKINVIMYKALIFDLDGTAIPNRRDGMPSKRVIEAVKKVKEKKYVSAATGRGIAMAGDIIKSLGLTAPCIIGGGTQVIDPISGKVLWEKDMSKDQIEKVMEIAREYQYPVFFGDDTEGSLPKYKITQREERIIYIEPVTKEDTKTILEKLSKIPDIAAHKVISWTPDHFDIHITHIEATKRHSMEVLLKILKVDKDEVVAIGDSDNDLPLFELAGYKVAMENGSEELKKKADMIAPSVNEDGLAVVLEKLFT